MPLRLRAPASQVANEFVVVGHVTVDRFETGHEQAGGSAFYSAALAARCGLGVTLITAGSPAVVATALGDLLDEVDVVLAPEDTSTTLLTWFEAGQRHQRVLAAASPISLLPLECDALHLAPVLREVGPEWAAPPGAQITGLTPQGLVRHWDTDGEIRLAATPGLTEYAPDLVVLSEHEVVACRELIEAVPARGGTVVVTGAGAPAEVRTGAGVFRVEAIPTEVQEELGAGDVFAAALLIALRDGADVHDGVRFAHAAASLRLGGLGPDAIPTRAAIDAHLAGVERP